MAPWSKVSCCLQFIRSRAKRSGVTSGATRPHRISRPKLRRVRCGRIGAKLHSIWPWKCLRWTTISRRITTRNPNSGLDIGIQIRVSPKAYTTGDSGAGDRGGKSVKSTRRVRNSENVAVRLANDGARDTRQAVPKGDFKGCLINLRTNLLMSVVKFVNRVGESKFWNFLDYI